MISQVSVGPLFYPKALIRVTGDDAFAFLQGQFTNELRKEPGAATYGLWLNQKGKVLAESHVLRVAEREFLLASATSPAAVIQKRLEDYIVADDVMLTDETDAVRGVSLWGAGAGGLMAGLLGEAPRGGRFIRHGDVIAFCGHRLPGENHVLLGPEARIRKLREQVLGRGCQEASHEEMEYARIAAGLPGVPQDVGPGDLPNEGGLEDSALSYTKGCYLGQEVMARLKNLGQVRRRLHVVRGRGPAPAALTALYQGQKKVGEVRSSARRGDEFVACAMLSLVNLNPQAGLSLVPDGPAVVTLDHHG